MRTIVETMTRREAAATRRPELREMKCVIIQHDHEPNIYWKRRSDGYTADLEEAGLYSLSEAIGITSFDGYTICFISEAPLEPRADGKKQLRLIAVVLGNSVLSMVKAAPNNPTVRAHIMAKVGQMPPDTLDTFEKLKDWIEYDLERLPGEAIKLPGTPASPATRPTPPAEAFIVMTRNSDTQRGTCTYSQQNTSQSQVPIMRDFILGLAQNDDYSLEEIVDEVAAKVDDLATEYERNSDTSNIEYDNYECTEIDDWESDFSRIDLTSQITTFLRANLTREQLDDFGL